MLVYGHGCYETVFSVADGKVPLAASLARLTARLKPCPFQNLFLKHAPGFENSLTAGNLLFQRVINKLRVRIALLVYVGEEERSRWTQTF